MIGLPFLTADDRPPCMDAPSLFWDDSYLPAEDVPKAAVRQSQDAEVRAVCHTCPFMASCMEWAVKHEEYGHWAGTSPAQRDQLRRKWNITLDRVQTERVGAHDWAVAERARMVRETEARMARVERKAVRDPNTGRFSGRL